MGADRLARAMAAIDAMNAEDPRRQAVGEAEMVTAWLARLRPQAGEALLLAARAHHIRRWAIPRTAYPEGRLGYLAWRKALHELHAGELRRILEASGYDESLIARAEAIVRKRDLWTDADVQALEDALCLVFLETQFDELAAKLERSKMIEVLRKTLRKMSEDGKRLALTVPLSDRGRELLDAAVRNRAADPS